MTAPRIGLIVARDRVFGVGKSGGIPWRFPADTRFCRDVTLGCGIVMGRRTWESIPANARPLAHRRSFVISSGEIYPPGTPYPPGVQRVHNFAAAVAAASRPDPHPMPLLWVFGGASLYNSEDVRRDVVEIYETVVPGDHDCDTALTGWEDYLSKFWIDWEHLHPQDALIFRHHRRG